MKIYAVGGYAYRSYWNWIENVEIVENMKDADVVMFFGGEDVSPALYKHANLASYISPTRDVVEVKAYKEAKELGKFCYGVCRGGQFLNVMSGGKMIQDFTGHRSVHNVMTSIGELVQVSSSHHQLMYPFTTKHELLAWVPRNEKHEYVFDGEVDMQVEVEAVYFPDTNCLCHQFHPEYHFPCRNDEQEKFIKYCRAELNYYANRNKQQLAG